jgi:hypothetical protein
MRKWFGLLLAPMLLLASAAPALAAEVRQSDNVVVGAGETVHDDLYAFGSTVTILGTVDGDVYAAGNTVTIGGTVTGGVYAGGSTLNVSADIRRSLHAGGGTVSVTGPIGGDVLIGGGTVTLAPSARVGRDLLIGGSAQVAAPVGRNVLASGENLAFSAPVGGSVRATGGSLRLDSGSSVAGDVSYASGRELESAPDAVVHGQIIRLSSAETTAVAPASPLAAWTAAFIGWLKGLVGLAIVGLLLVLMFPAFTNRATTRLTRAPWTSLGLGASVLLVTPVAILVTFVIGLLIGGWWIALLLLPLYLAAAILGYVFAAVTAGTRILAALDQPHRHPVWALGLGLIVFGVLGLIPFAGGIIALVAMCAGLGGLVVSTFETYRARTQPVEAAESLYDVPRVAAVAA